MNLNILNFKNLTNKVKFVDGNELSANIGNINTRIDDITSELNQAKYHSKIQFYDATIEGQQDYKNKLKILDGAENGYLYYVKHYSELYDAYQIVSKNEKLIDCINSVFDEIENDPNRQNDSDKYWLMTNFDEITDDDKYTVVDALRTSKALTSTTTEEIYIRIDNLNQFVAFFKDLHNNDFVNFKFSQFEYTSSSSHWQSAGSGFEPDLATEKYEFDDQGNAIGVPEYIPADIQEPAFPPEPEPKNLKRDGDDEYTMVNHLIKEEITTLKIVITNNIDLSDKIWLPIGYDMRQVWNQRARYELNNFSTIEIIGLFDNDQSEALPITISGLKIKQLISNKYVGFFSSIVGKELSINNIIFDSPIVSSNICSAGVIAGGFSFGNISTYFTTIKNASVKSFENAGLITGCINEDNKDTCHLRVKNCTFENNKTIYNDVVLSAYGITHSYKSLVEFNHTYINDGIIDEENNDNVYENNTPISIKQGQLDFNELVDAYCIKNEIVERPENILEILPVYDYDLMFVTESLDGSQKLVFSF